MGRAINMENRQDDLERRLKLVEDALEELVQTKIHHVDLVEDIQIEKKPKKKKDKKETISV
jgi:hypothetical protein